MSARKRHLFWILPLAAVLGTGIWWTVRKTEGPRVEALALAELPMIQTIVVSGRVVQPRQSRLGALTRGTVEEILVDDGDRVEADALLVRLVDDDALASLAEAEAAVLEAEARLKRVRGVGRKMAVQALNQANIEAEQAEIEYKRQLQLFRNGAASELSLERARRDRDQNLSIRISASLEAAATAKKGSDVQMAAAALARAQARLNAARVAVDRTQIRAPSSGVVLKRHVEVSEVVQSGEPLITFAGDGSLEVRIQPDESNLGLLKVGQRAVISAEAFPDQRVNGSISRIAPSVDPIRGTVEVDLAIDDQSLFRPDMTVTVEIEVGRAEAATILPSFAIRDLGGETPWVLIADKGEAQRRNVKLGLEGDDLVQILSGLTKDDRVLPPDLPIDEGDPVRVRKIRPAVQGQQ